MSENYVNITFFVKNPGVSYKIYNPATKSLTSLNYGYPGYMTIGIPVYGNYIRWELLGYDNLSYASFQKGRNYVDYKLDWTSFLDSITDSKTKRFFITYDKRNIKQNNINVDIWGKVGNGYGITSQPDRYYPTYMGYNNNNVQTKNLTYSKFGAMSSDNLWNYYWIIFAVVALFLFLKKRRK